MNLTFAEDFTTSNQLDSELIGTPDSGLFWNRGVHPSVSIDNLLTFLPIETITYAAYVAGTTYTNFSTSRKRSDIVTYDGSIYFSKSSANVGNTPSEDSDYWQLTNENSLRLRAFLWKSEGNVLSALSLNRKLIENQYLYHIGETAVTLSADYSGFAYEPKGSDYVRIRINQMSLQANTTDPVSVYVVNQGALVTTLTLNPNNGFLEFEDIDYSFIGKGVFYFVFDSQEVLTNDAVVDPLKFDGVVCYPVTGVGDSAAEAEYTMSSCTNGLNFNFSCYLDSSQYVTNNAIDFAKFYQAQFEMDAINLFLYNSNNRTSTEQRMQQAGIDSKILATQALSLEMDTVARRYQEQKRIALSSINRTFDRFLKPERRSRFKATRGVM